MTGMSIESVRQRQKDTCQNKHQPLQHGYLCCSTQTQFTLLLGLNYDGGHGTSSAYLLEVAQNDFLNGEEEDNHGD